MQSVHGPCAKMTRYSPCWVLKIVLPLHYLSICLSVFLFVYLSICLIASLKTKLFCEAWAGLVSGLCPWRYACLLAWTAGSEFLASFLAHLLARPRLSCQPSFKPEAISSWILAWWACLCGSMSWLCFKPPLPWPFFKPPLPWPFSKPPLPWPFSRPLSSSRPPFLWPFSRPPFFLLESPDLLLWSIFLHAHRFFELTKGCRIRVTCLLQVGVFLCVCACAES